ncbi:universal stress protein [Planosporangium thailandense]|uniref:Universal stress protein n=1 Tax=Planosporangium thailandense TaxID=765197 RepID=A0ABX0XVJ5_9ACTN|nr:universal stress protein [Planosporangium thailandense]NJC70050.1 universal stress protein [Planosporangium thailandense]
MSSGPVIVGYDGTPAAEHALRETAALLFRHHVLVVVVWEAGRAFERATQPIAALEEPPTVLDVRAGFELDQAAYEAAERTAQHGATLARAAGLDAESLVVADDATVSDTLIRLARERDSPAVVVGTHGHRALSELLLGSTSRDLIQRAPCPVVVVRDHRSARG